MQRTKIKDMSIAYRDEGAGPVVVLLHGWPTSSHLWNAAIPAIARHNRVIAVDLPGFGQSDKPVDVRYDFEFFADVLDGLLDTLDVERAAVVGHDIGGPIAVDWALRRPDRVTDLVLLNTVLYPQFHPSVLEFVAMLSTPASRERLTSASGLTGVLRLGLADPSHATEDIVAAVIAPFGDEPARLALAKAGIELSPSGFAVIERGLPTLGIPIRVIYGAQDRILPDVAETMARVQRDLPHAVVTALPDCGHFLQYDAPDEVAAMLAECLFRSPVDVLRAEDAAIGPLPC